MTHRNSRIHAKTALSPGEEEIARVTPVWIVWWEDPDRSWESLCLSLAESETEYAARHADHLIQHWGTVGKKDQQSLLAWLEGHLRGVPSASAHDYVNTAKEILRRVSIGESGPVIVRTW